MIIRKAAYDDLPRIMEVCEQAGGIMRPAYQKIEK